jgi:hypothetical protein
MRVFKIKWFNQWAIKAGITDDSLRQALSEIETGLIDANLGGDVYKQRVRFQGRGNVVVLVFLSHSKPVIKSFLSMVLLKINKITSMTMN